VSARLTIRLGQGEQFRRAEDLSPAGPFTGDVMSNLTPPNSVSLIG